jgi:hypothetical protein
MEWANLIVTALAFLIVFLHQRKKIKNLSDQISGQQKLFDSLKAFIEGVNPDLLVFRTKQYEELVSKEAKIQLKEIENQFKEQEKNLVESRNKSTEWVTDLTMAVFYALPYIPKNGIDVILNQIENKTLRTIFLEKLIPRAEQMQLEARREAAKQLGCMGIESKIGTGGL